MIDIATCKAIGVDTADSIIAIGVLVGFFVGLAFGAVLCLAWRKR